MRSIQRKCQAQCLLWMYPTYFFLTPKVGGARDLWSKARWVSDLLCDIRLVTGLL